MVETFSIGHFTAIAINLIIVTVVYFISIKFKAKRIIFASLLTLIFLFDNLSRIVNFSDGNVWNLLPFSLCGIAYMISIVAIFSNSEKLFKYSIFFSIGTFIAILAPSNSGLQHWSTVGSIRYHSTHLMILTAQVFMYRQLGWRIKKGDSLKVSIALTILAISMFILNTLVKTNFLFLNEKLEGNALTQYLGEWPVYLIWFFTLGYLLMFLFEKLILKVQRNG